MKLLSKLDFLKIKINSFYFGFLMLILTLLQSHISLSQATWQTTGNTNLGGSTQPIIGTMSPLDQPLLFYTNGIQRMIIRNATTSDGRIAFGNNLPLGFLPSDRLHVHHTNLPFGNVMMRFTNDIVGSSTSDGTNLGMMSNGDFRLTQFELKNIDFFTPRISTLTPLLQVNRLRISERGQVFIGNELNTNEIIEMGTYGKYNNGGYDFSQSETSLLNVRGPINSCFPYPGNGEIRTIMYAYSKPLGNPTFSPVQDIDGFRMQFQSDYYGSGGLDALIFEKTSGQKLKVDGGFAFTNMSTTGVRNMSLSLRGDGRAYFGNNISEANLLSNINSPCYNNRVGIDSESGDASESGLRFIDLTSSDIPVVNPNTTNRGVLSVDNCGNVIYVKDVSGAVEGLHCWDLNGDGIGNTNEDIDGNGQWNALDCRGPQGIQGVQGPAGTGGGASLGAHNGTSINTLDINNPKVVLGQNIGEALNPGQLLSNREIPMGTHQLNFNNGFLNVNSQAGEFNLAGLNVRPANAISSYNPNFPVYLANRALNVVNNNIKPIGIESSANDVSGSAFAIGIVSSASSVYSGATVVGTDSYGDGLSLASSVGGSSTIGLRATSKNSLGESMGVYGIAEGNSKISYGVKALARGTSEVSFGLYASATGGSIDNYAGFFDGKVKITGQIWNNGTLITSDKRYKKEIVKLEKTTDKIKNLNGYSYSMRTDEFADKNFSNDKQIGLIAQEIKEVFPELVQEDKNGFLAVNYDGMIPVLLEVAKEQQVKIDEQQKEMVKKDEKIEDLNNRLTQLESCLSALLPTLCSLNQDAIQSTSKEEQTKIQSEVRNAIEVKLNDKNTIILSQNVPNPFAESTVIRFTIPVNVKTAQIHFYTANGVIINSIDITERGNGELIVFAQDLSSGMYSYTLVADGKVVATKKMVKE